MATKTPNAVRKFDGCQAKAVHVHTRSKTVKYFQAQCPVHGPLHHSVLRNKETVQQFADVHNKKNRAAKATN